MGVEHVERQEEREAELRADADELERKGDELEERGEEFEQRVGDVREDWEQKKGTGEVPGAQAPDDDLVDTETEEDGSP